MKNFFAFLLLTIPLHGYTQKLSVSLFNEHNLQTLLITPVSGSYLLMYGDNEFILFPNQIIYISRVADSVIVRDMSSNLGTWKRVSLVGRTDNDVIRINPVSPSIPARIYDDNLSFYVDFNRLMAINLVDQENYVAGVVEAESGPSAHIEFYKVQAMLVRTYALGHMDKHSGEGFNLCDEVHCQVYKGKSTRNPDILKAAEETHGLVIVDSTKQLIVGAFHANCGGQTANSGDVWITPQSYLSSVNDPYCKSMPSSHWEVKIPIEQWRSFLKSKGVEVDSLPDSKFVYNAINREYIYHVNGKEIPFTDIRSHFKLRSAYFSIDFTSKFIRLKGKGYGHGVGLCQDGAMQMAKKGFDYQKIVKHYFTGVEIINFSEIESQQQDHEEADDEKVNQDI